MIQIWRLMKPELSHAKVAYGLIFLLMFVFYTAVSLSGHEAINFVLFFSHTTFLVLFTRGTNVLIALPVTMATIGVVRVSAQTGAILVALVGSSLAASLFSKDPSTLLGTLLWIFPLVVTVTSLQWIWFDSAFANRSSRQLTTAVKIWCACYGLGTLALVFGKLGGLLSLLKEGYGMIVLWPVAVTVSYLSVLSFRRRLSFVPVEPRAWGESTSRLVKHGRYAPLTILFNQMVSHWKAYVLSYALMGALFWWMGRNPDAWDLDRPIWWARIAGTIVACVSMGFIVQRIEKGEAPNEFQYLLLPVSARQVATYRIIEVLPYAIPLILFWFVVILRQSPGPLYGPHWSFLALLGWICAGGATGNLVWDLWPRLRFGKDVLTLGASFGPWCFVAALSVGSPESIVGGLGRSLLWSPGGAGLVLVAGAAMALISVRTYERSPSRLV